MEDTPAMPNEQQTGVIPPCPPGTKRPRNEPEGKCEKERKLSAPKWQSDYVVPKPKPNPKPKPKPPKKK